MAREPQRVHKHYRLNAARIRDVQQIFCVATETEAVERALEFVLAEQATNRLAAQAHRRFLSRGGTIRDAYGVLDTPTES